MIEQVRYDRLNTAIESIISSGEFASSGDQDVDALARLASGLRGLPDPDFRARLAVEFREDAKRGVVSRVMSLAPFAWLMRQRAFAAAGGSCGLVAGACCLSGAFAHVTGLATAAAVTAYIHSTIPYFVGLSILAVLACLVWSLRPHGFTVLGAGLTLRRHGVVFVSGYAAAFAASMVLTMAMGLY